MKGHHDLVIVGGGAAAFSAAIRPGRDGGEGVVIDGGGRGGAPTRPRPGLCFRGPTQPGVLSPPAGGSGPPPAPPHLYAGGARVYVVEASMGDDSGNADYSLGDDGLVVTNAQGRIIE